MKIGSLFAGIGGLDIGMEQMGMQVSWQIENDLFCQKVLQRHWPVVQRYSDIRAVQGQGLEWVNGIIAGFPCQDVSVAGKRRGVETEGDWELRFSGSGRMDRTVHHELKFE